MEPMPHPDVVLLEGHADGPMLYRYTAHGDFGGDTWHETLDDAKRQAVLEYGGRSRRLDAGSRRRERYGGVRDHCRTTTLAPTLTDVER
jgi:hypothetical protein